MSQLIHNLREQILTGAIPAGSRLKIEVLQRETGLSSSPLREALSRLVAEGLVVSEENRGFRAAPLSATDLRDITQMRLLLETSALEDSIRHGTVEWETGIVGAHYQFQKQDQRIARGEAPPDQEWTRLHKAFHLSLVAACSFPKLLAMCSSLFDQSERYRRLSASTRVAPRNTQDEHQLLMEAVLKRDQDGARAMLTQHISRTAENVLRILDAVPEKKAQA
jgi:DNA-binding GntR family transcriptional regulator